MAGAKALEARILYWGIEGAGKTTNLQTIHGKLRADNRGELEQVPRCPLDAALVIHVGVALPLRELQELLSPPHPSLPINARRSSARLPSVSVLSRCRERRRSCTSGS